MIAFTIITCVTVFFVRRYAAPDMVASDAPDLNRHGAALVGQVVVVTEAITAGACGKVRAADTFWSAEGCAAPPETRVRVMGVKGTVLTVGPA